MAAREPREPEPEEWRALMVAYQGGDLEAFDCLYARLAPILKRFLLSLARDGAWTDDLLQEAFLQIHRSRQTYSAAYPLLPWALAVARHVFLMSRRSRGRKHELDRQSEADLEEVATGGEEARILAQDRLARGLAALTPGTRRAVWLHHVAGWSFKDIGARLGIRGSAAKLRASRGVSALRRELGSIDEGHDRSGEPAGAPARKGKRRSDAE